LNSLTSVKDSTSLVLKNGQARHAVVIIAVVTAVIMLLKFGEQWLLARGLGAGERLDAYFLGQIVLLLGAQLAVAVTSAAVPILMTFEEPGRRIAAQRMSVIVLVATTVTLAVIAALSGPLVWILHGSLDRESVHLASNIFLWLLPATGACILAALLRAYWHAHRNFVLPGVGQIFMPLCTCGGALLVAGGVWNLRDAAAVANVGAFLLVLLLCRPILHSAENNFSVSYRKLTWRLAAAFLPVAAASSLIPIMVAECRGFASWLTHGSVATISLAVSIASIPGQLASASIGMVLLPQANSMFVKGQHDEAANIVDRALRTTSFIVIPCAIEVLLYSREAVEVVFRRGVFDRTAVQATASALIGFGFGVPALASMQVLMFALLATNKAKQVGITAVFTLLAMMILNRLLLNFGLMGLAVAFSVTCYLNAGVLLGILLLALPGLGIRSLMSSHLRILAISLTAGFVSNFLARQLRINDVLEFLLVTVLVMIVLYVALSVISGSPEMREMLEIPRRTPQSVTAKY
jgi:putative peptidoglycan lipid II flippase